ncbi:MAG TPA: bifunctional glutamate N-acetyltransferase/amino-acid acetyltransferase ArgJ [Dissulfurispiraceae bacterium]|nr:bifunctional glutamate N-acetyltransferase/amino-acid acetyltransferase ArgJ [Dissulfurispiraceae bacterium]
MPINSKKTVVPKGFLFSAVEAAVKKPGRKDLALIYSEHEAKMAGMFTTNSVKAAPVKLDMGLIRQGKGRAIIVNSGNANACTGRQGMKDAVEMCRLVANHMGINDDYVYVCSTGVIGTPMPMARIRPIIGDLVAKLGSASINDVAAAIMTTDTFSKIIVKKKRIGGRMITVTGICKGAGMIQPNMATMLSFVLTDAAIESKALGEALRQAVNRSFNRITIDGDMSTNDTVLIMANGAAGNEVIKKGSDEYEAFSGMLQRLTYELSELIVRDGEGATKFVEVEIKNARTEKEAEKGAFAIANSLLVKTAIYGNDANWGRLMAALGYSGIMLKEEKTDITINGLKVVKGGIATGVDVQANERLKEKKIKIIVDLHLGEGCVKVLTCDLTENYVQINAEYRT